MALCRSVNKIHLSSRSIKDVWPPKRFRAPVRRPALPQASSYTRSAVRRHTGATDACDTGAAIAVRAWLERKGVLIGKRAS